jgi:hypothetical protein
MRMPTAKKMALWSDFEGRVLEGRYRLGKLVRSEGRVAWFDAESGEERDRVTVSVTETLNDEDSLLKRLQAASQIRHPNVVAIHEVGVAKVAGTPLVYAVMEPIEQSLNDVLLQRSLTVAETRQVVNAVVEGLGAFHERGLVHGKVEAASVVSMGETVKLRSDCVQTVEQGAPFEACAAEDLRGVSSIIGQALPQRLAKDSEGSRAHPLLATPVGVIRHDVKEGTGVTQIAAALKSNAVEKPAAKAEPAVVRPITSDAMAKQPETVTEKYPEAAVRSGLSPAVVTNRAMVPQPEEDAVAESGFRMRRPVAADTEGAPRRMDSLAASSMTRKSAPYIAGAAVVLVLVLGIMGWGMMHRASHSATAKTTVSVPAAFSSAAAPSATTQPGAAPYVAMTPTVATPAPAHQGLWRVVAWTYDQQDQAEKKAQTIAAKYPQLAPAVFSPGGNGKQYLVTLGGAMDREESFRMRAEAIRAGLPGDTYARNFRNGTVVSQVVVPLK